MKPTIGRIVHYTLTEKDALEIIRRRTNPKAIGDRIQIIATTVEMPGEIEPQPHRAWPLGAQAHIGNPVHEGEVYPAMIVRVWGDQEESCVNLQVFLDGTDVLWVTSAQVAPSSEAGRFHWPARE